MHVFGLSHSAVPEEPIRNDGGKEGGKPDPYRWVVLGVFLLITVVAQALWICYAPVATAAADAWGVPTEQVDLLASLFMLLYLPAAIPAAWAIDYFGFKKAVGFGAVLTGLFGLLRGLYPASYFVTLVGTAGIALAQPFLLSAFTKLAALWFPKKHRATVTGVLFLAVFFGVGLGLVLSPWLLEKFHFAGLQMVYGVSAAAAALLFLIFARSHPPATPLRQDVARALVTDGFRSLLGQRDVYRLSLILFLGGGIVNSAVTLIDGLRKEKGFSSEQGVALSLVLLAAGMLGSLLLSAVSDGLRQRKAIIALAIFTAAPATLCLAVGHGFPLAMACFFVLGFFATGVTPVAYQYGAEITQPVPEGTSNGILALVVQASGIWIVLTNALKTFSQGSYALPFAGLALAFAASGIWFLSARESPDMRR